MSKPGLCLHLVEGGGDRFERPNIRTLACFTIGILRLNTMLEFSKANLHTKNQMQRELYKGSQEGSGLQLHTYLLDCSLWYFHSSVRHRIFFNLKPITLPTILMPFPDLRFCAALDNLNTSNDDVAQVWLKKHHVRSLHY
jgi:hypothetical protein